MSIILTDWPKFKTIPANMRGITTERLLDIRNQLFHSMMDETSETVGGYHIFCSAKAIEKELKFRKVAFDQR